MERCYSFKGRIATFLFSQVSVSPKLFVGNVDVIVAEIKDILHPVLELSVLPPSAKSALRCCEEENCHYGHEILHSFV